MSSEKSDAIEDTILTALVWMCGMDGLTRSTAAQEQIDAARAYLRAYADQATLADIATTAWDDLRYVQPIIWGADDGNLTPEEEQRREAYVAQAKLIARGRLA